MERRSFTYEAREDTLIIHMPEELDHHNCRGLKGDTDLLLEENYVKRIIFDFTETRFMDSSGIGVLLNRYKQMAASRGTVAYYGAGPQVKRILELGGIGRLIRGYGTREAAIAEAGRTEIGKEEEACRGEEGCRGEEAYKGEERRRAGKR